MVDYQQYKAAQSALAKLRTAAATASTAQTMAQRDYDKAQAEADKWEVQYQLALKEGNQGLISQAKYQKDKSELIAKRLKKLLDDQQQQVDKIKNSLKTWEDKISEIQKQVLVPKVNSSTNTNFFETIEDKYLETKEITQDTSSVSISFEDVDEVEDFDDYLQLLKESLLLKPTVQEINHSQQDVYNILSKAIQETEETIAKAVTNQEGIHKDVEKAQKEAKYWNEKAQIALKNNEDDLALQAVVNKTVQNKIALTIQTQLQEQEKIINLLVQNLMILENVKKIFDTLQNQDSIPNTKQIIDFNSIIIDTDIDALRRELDTL